MTGVAFLVDQLFSPAPGGIGSYIRNLLPALAREDPDLAITLFHGRFHHRPGDGFVERFPVVELSRPISLLYPSWALIGRPSLPSSLAELEIVHAPSPASIPPADRRQRRVITVHDLAFLVHPDLYPRRWALMYRVGLARAVREADALVAVSRHTASDLLWLTGAAENKVHVAPLAASLPIGDTDVTGTLDRLKIRPPYILTVGTLEPRKNLVRLIRAFRRLAASSTAPRLVLAGPVGWRPEALLRELAAEGPGEVILTGLLPPADLDALYRGAEAFAYPSLYEGFGIPVLEALARAIPCLVSASSSLPEVAGDAALAVDPLSVGTLAHALERLVSDDALKDRLSRAGPGRAARFSWEDTARRTAEIYHALS